MDTFDGSADALQVLAPGAAVLWLAVYAVAADAIGWTAIRARDVP
jgi:hypothetical protein